MTDLHHDNAATESMLDELAALVSESRDLEGLVQPLLEMLETTTGFESTYLTSIDSTANIQTILVARNTKTLNIPEGLEVPWGDTLCKRAIEEGVTYCDQVQSHWSDSAAARKLGISTFLSEPIYIGDGELFGTLCAASAARIPITPHVGRMIRMFAQLIARQLESERLVWQLRQQNIAFSKYALADPLTGIPNRRAMTQELQRLLARAEREGTAVHLAFIDLDGFKAINDEHGHDAGDRFLMEIARRLQRELRDSDLVARYGGDEFVVASMAASPDDEHGRAGLAERLTDLLVGRYFLDTLALNYAGASVGAITSGPGERDPEALVARADAAMYRIKQRRRSR